METTPRNTRVNGVTPSPEGIRSTGDGGFVAEGEAATRMIQLTALRIALRREIISDMKMFRGSILSTLQAMGITTKRTKKGAFKDLNDYIVQCGGVSMSLDGKEAP